MGAEMYMLWLSSLYELGSHKQNALLSHFGDARSIFDAPEKYLYEIGELTENNVSKITGKRDMSLVESMLAEMVKQKIAYISRDHDDFPALLKGIPDPPVGLFVLGDMPGEESHRVGIIGSRRCSEYGLSATRLLAKPLPAYGITIVSGMARGIDGIAHKCALEGGGKTIAVLGSGVDICYPAEHRALREDIIANGCVVSEYPPGVKPFPAFFPARNRIISGLSSVLVVVEAAKKSGTLITVDQAQDQGRDVMAVPGSILSSLSEGTNKLINEGALPAISHEDIISALGITNEPKNQAKIQPTSNTLAPDEKIVYDILNFLPMPFDELAMLSGSTLQSLHYICTMLELKGFIKKLPGQRYIRNN